MRLFPITIDISKLTADMIEWAKKQGADVWCSSDEDNVKYNQKSHNRGATFIRMPESKISRCYEESGGRLHFSNSQKEVALIFLMIYHKYIINHNMEELKAQENTFYATT